MIKLDDLKKINKEVVKITTSLSQAAEDVLKAKALTFLDDGLVNQRLDKCHKCMFYNSSRCGACGCFLPVKAKILEFNCPLGVWNSERLPKSWEIDPNFIDTVPKAFHCDGQFTYAYAKDSQGIIKYITNLETQKTETVRL